MWVVITKYILVFCFNLCFVNCEHTYGHTHICTYILCRQYVAWRGQILLFVGVVAVALYPLPSTLHTDKCVYIYLHACSHKLRISICICMHVFDLFGIHCYFCQFLGRQALYDYLCFNLSKTAWCSLSLRRNVKLEKKNTTVNSQKTVNILLTYLFG